MSLVHSPEELGAAIRAFRKERGLTQADAADLAGVGPRFLSELERGKATAELGRVMPVLERFGLPLTLAQRGGRPLEREDPVGGSER